VPPKKTPPMRVGSVTADETPALPSSSFLVPNWVCSAMRLMLLMAERIWFWFA
jgi:hypothetical protein